MDLSPTTQKYNVTNVLLVQALDNISNWQEPINGNSAKASAAQVVCSSSLASPS